MSHALTPHTSHTAQASRSLPQPEPPYAAAHDAALAVETRHEAGTYRKRPIQLVRGAGAIVEDAHGRQYIDCTAGIGVAVVGHANPRVTQAIVHQAERLTTCAELFYNDIRAAYLAQLVAALPTGLDRVFLCNSGTEAVEAALKFARLSTGRVEIVAALRGFHGRTFGALSATWEPRYRAPFGPLVPGFRHIRFGDEAALASALTEQTAAVVLEVVQGEGGVHVASADYLRAAARLCHERGALLILDEVQTGFGRTGQLWACEHAGVTPDLLCLAKGIAGGLPMGATCLGPRVAAIPSGAHGSTFGGNPLACAAASATLTEIQERRLPERAAELGGYILERLRVSLAASPHVRDVRGLGLLVGIELRHHAQHAIDRLAERGVLALYAGPYVIRLLPPLVVERAQIEQVAVALEEVLR